MSTDYYLVCPGCKSAFGGDGWPTSPHAMAYFLKQRESLTFVAWSVKTCPVDLRLTMGFELWDGMEADNLEFFIAHEGHPLQVMNEYDWFDLQYKT